MADTVPDSPRAARPLHRRLAETAVGNTVVQVVVALVVAALAASRAAAHLLSPAGLVGIESAGVPLPGETAAIGGLLAWIAGAYFGALDVLSGEAELDCSPHCPAAPAGDPWTATALWRAAPLWSAAAAAWALAGAGLVAVVLDGEHAGLGVLFVCVAAFSGCAAVTIDTVARHRGAHAARRLLLEPPAPVPLSRRAWLEIALPMAGVQALVHVGMAWLLFHDYRVHQPFAPKALTRSVALGDIGVVVLALVLIFAVVLARPWGEVDARLGRVALDDPHTQSVPPKAPIGAQGIVYAALICWLFAAVVGWFLPANPTLVQVMVARAFYAAVLTLVFTAIGYIRGAVNALATAPAPPDRTDTATDTATTATTVLRTRSPRDAGYGSSERRGAGEAG